MTPRLKPPLNCNHIPASDWLCVFDVEEPGGKISLHREPVIAWRLETFQVGDVDVGSNRFDALTPILAGGSVSLDSLYVLQWGSVYFTGDERIDSQDEVIAWFAKQRKQNGHGRA